jgi:hypothetical protein
MFDVVKYAKDSDARIASVTPVSEAPADAAERKDAPERKSETRLVSRSRVESTLSDEAWASARIGAATVVMPSDDLIRLPLDHRAGFLLSLMDGTLDLETLVSVSPMARADALCLVRDLFENRVIIFR